MLLDGALKCMRYEGNHHSFLLEEAVGEYALMFDPAQPDWICPPWGSCMCA